MKQEVSSYLFTLKDRLCDLSKFLYNNPEDSFHEHKACTYIIEILNQHGFKVSRNFLQMPTAFYAEYGSGHPKVCYLCEYDAIPDKGHITGHNLISTISVGAAVALSKVVDKLKGTVIIIGCPGEFRGGSKVTMAKQGIFDDIDAVLMAHPDTSTAESGTSSAIIPISVKYTGKDGLSYMKPDGFSSLDASLFTFTSLNLLIKGFSKDITLDGIINNGGFSPSILAGETEARFYIRGRNIKSVSTVENKIRELVKTVESLMEVGSDVSFFELPCEELISNPTLSRIFSHNLKECGIIKSSGIKDTSAGLSLGTVSHYAPCIHPYIGIVEDQSIPYYSAEFAQATISDYALETSPKSAQALAITGVDLLMNESLLSEVKNEYYKLKEA